MHTQLSYVNKIDGGSRLFRRNILQTFVPNVSFMPAGPPVQVGVTMHIIGIGSVSEVQMVHK